MEETVSYLLMVQEYIISKQKTQKDFVMCLGNVSKDFTINNMNKTVFKGVVKIFSVDFSPIATNDILHIYKYLMERTWYKIMFGLIKKILIGLLTGLVNGSNYTK